MKSYAYQFPNVSIILPTKSNLKNHISREAIVTHSVENPGPSPCTQIYLQWML